MCATPRQEITGYVVATVSENAIDYLHCFGYANRENRLKYDTTTIQPVGSVSKTLIGIALMKAQEQDLLNLDQDINEYLDFVVANPLRPASEVITLRHLATHTSGMVDNMDVYLKTYTSGLKPDMELGAFLKSYFVPGGAKYAEANFYDTAPGTRYSYCNMGSALAAYIVERVSGMSYREYTKKYILQPLGMMHSGWFYSDIDQKRHAILYDEEDQPLNPYSIISYPDGSLRTTITDLSRYLQELIKGYNGHSTLLSTDSWKELFQQAFSEKKPTENIDPQEPNSGIFMMYNKAGEIGHTGSDFGVSAIMWFNPKTGKGHIFMANEDLTEDNVEAFKVIWKKLKQEE